MKLKQLTLALSAIFVASAACAATDADVDYSFDPYKNALPSVPGAVPGTIISKANVQKFKDLLDPATYALIEQGSLEIPITETHSIPLSPNYIAATKKYANQVKLGSAVGTIEGYVAGRPFPFKPDKNDPRAGEKLAFNYKYTQIVGDSGRIYPFKWKYKNAATGNTERELDFDFHFISFKHRTTQEPKSDIEPNPSKIYRGIYLKVLNPPDLKNTQLLIQRYDDDTKVDDSYLYLGFQRRVRRLATGQTTDSFLGSDIMIEDFEGYNGRVLDMTWKYVETKVMLMPFYRHSELKLTEPKDTDGYGQVTFGGKAGCFPNVPWSLRIVHVLEGVPTLQSSPIGKRVVYMDAQSSVFPMTLIYDKKGDLWKRWGIGFTDSAYHVAANKNAGIAIYTSASMMDMQAQHCTTFQPRMISDAALNPPTNFSVQYLRGGD
ncbi:MAG: DUF1329 domain-containing protein [Rhodocyclaceae bacterium]|nr:MAG: DUF1329 domain-containing protein [Rhodocyclaceae bacterium]